MAESVVFVKKQTYQDMAGGNSDKVGQNVNGGNSQQEWATRKVQGIPPINRNMHGIIKYVIRTCIECQKCKPINYNPGGPTRSHKPTEPFEKVSIDLMGPLPKGRGGTHYILDTFSKYIKLYALKRATTKVILKRIMEDYIPTSGKPRTILTGNRTQFKSKIWGDTLREKDIEPQYTTRYHPQANPVERYNREFGRILRIYCSVQHYQVTNIFKTN